MASRFRSVFALLALGLSTVAGPLGCAADFDDADAGVDELTEDAEAAQKGARDECEAHGFNSTTLLQLCRKYAGIGAVGEERRNRDHGVAEAPDKSCSFVKKKSSKDDTTNADVKRDCAKNFGHKIYIAADTVVVDALGQPLEQNNSTLEKKGLPKGPMRAGSPLRGYETARIAVFAGVVPCGAAGKCVFAWNYSEEYRLTGNGRFPGLIPLTTPGSNGRPSVAKQLSSWISAYEDAHGERPMQMLARRSRSAITDGEYAKLADVGFVTRTIRAIDVEGSVPAYTDANGRAPASVYGDRYDNGRVPGVITPPDSCGRDCVGQIDTFLPAGTTVKAVRHMEIGVRNVGTEGPKQHVFRLIVLEQQGVRQALWVPSAALI